MGLSRRVFPWKHQGAQMRLPGEMDWADVMIGVGSLIVALGIYLAAGGAAAVIFVGVVLVIMGILASLPQIRHK